LGQRSGLARALPLIVALLAPACESTPVLVYHHVGVALDRPRYVTVEDFEAQLRHLDEAGYTPITVSRYEAILAGEAPAPRRPIVLTFDDGDHDFYRYAYPALRAHGFVATNFLISDVLRESDAERVVKPWPYLVWPEIREMQAYGIEFQSHTVHHPRLTDLSTEQIRFELEGSKLALEAKLGQRWSPSPTPSRPFGRGAAPDPRGRLPERLFGRWGVNRDAERIRITIGSDHQLSAFVEVLEGTWWGESSGLR
jgi:peptidoglycan/xylan/chitin deacetylase (PgdA/CDA1 family)